jgi:hypothetical protein
MTAEEKADVRKFIRIANCQNRMAISIEDENWALQNVDRIWGLSIPGWWSDKRHEAVHLFKHRRRLEQKKLFNFDDEGEL